MDQERIQKMKGTYKRELNTSYLVLEEQVMNSAQYYQMKMVTENTPKHLLTVSIHNFNGEKQFYYDISGKQTIACLFEKKEMDVEQLVSILSGLSEVLSELENYFLEENYLCLNPEYMYINVNTKQLYLCFYPCEEEEFSMGVRRLAEYLLNCIDHQDEKAVAAGYQFYRFTREDNFSFGQIVEEILKEQEAVRDNCAGNFSKPSIYDEYECQKGGILENSNKNQSYNFENYASKNYTSENYEETSFYEEQQELDEQNRVIRRKEFKRIFFFFLSLILAGTGYGIYKYLTRNQTLPFTIKDFFASRDVIIATGAVIVGIVGFFLLFLYKKLLEKERNPDENEEETIRQQMEREYFARNERAYEADTNQMEACTNYDDFTEYGETVLLKENSYKEEGILVEKLKKLDKRQPLKIVLDGFPFVIGKLEGVADYVISDKSVSRVHAKFIKNEAEDMVYLMDLNSKNGTLKNGIPLEVNELVPLTAEDEITFGKVTFTYH